MLLVNSMNIVNDKITSLADLEDVDSTIAELQGLKARIQAVVDKKLADEPAEAINSVRRETAIEAVNFIKELTGVETSAAMVRISEGEEKYGKTAALASLEPLLHRKFELQHNQIFLSQAAKIEQQISHADIAESLTGIRTLMDETSDMVPSALKEQTYDRLTKLLHKKVETKRKSLEESLAKGLSQVNWLSSGDEGFEKQFDSTLIVNDFKQLISLQANTEGLGVPKYPQSWWSLDILLEPITSRFKFHFDTPNKDTNKLSKPEWAFEFIENFLKGNLDLVLLLIGDTFEKLDLIATFEIITTLLQPVRVKVVKMMGIINKNIIAYEGDSANSERTGRILSHMIFELSAFDQRLKNIYYYNPYTTLSSKESEVWLGLTYDLLLGEQGNESAGANNWIQFELNLATKRFNSEIIEPENSFNIDLDFLSSQLNTDTQLKPSYSAYNLTQLFDSLTSHYHTLNILKYQLKYVSNIQLKLIDLYASEIRLRLQKFNLSFSLKMSLNFLPKGLNRNTEKEAASNETSVANGLKGLQMLTELYCLAKYIRTQLQQWGDDLFFVELCRAYQQVSPSSEVSDTLFEPAISDYDKLLEDILAKYEDFFKKEIRTSLKSYVNSSQWNQPMLDNETIPDPSGELSMVVINMPVFLDYIQRCVSRSDYYVIVDKIVSLLSVILREYIITNNQFNSNGVKQLQVDVDFLTARLLTALLLDPQALTYNTLLNKDYLRIVDSVKFLNAVNVETALKYKRQYDKIGELRRMFDNNLQNLSDHSISDLIVRII